MRCGNHFIKPEQRMIRRRWLLDEHIEGGAAAFKPRYVDVVSSTPEEILNRAAG